MYRKKAGAIFDVKPYGISTYDYPKSNYLYSEKMLDLGLID